MALSWDGSYLGQILTTDVTELKLEGENRRDPKAKYYQINIKGQTIGPCLLKSQQSSFPCLIDEIKSIFG